MKEIRLMCLLMLLSAGLFGQEMREGINFPPFPVPEDYELKSGGLPPRVDNSLKKYFPPVFTQYGWSCNQASSIGYLLTYELARARDVSAYETENQYPPLYAWNFLNNAANNRGVSYFDSWEIIKANGCPNYIDYPYRDDVSAWMTGYDKYYRAMKNKVHNNYSMGVGDPEGLERLKRYLYDHYTGSKHGGCANFQIASGGIRFANLPPESYNAGKPIITSFGSVVGHAMTIVGYDDSVKMDFNGDGKYTNDLDINGDFIVDLKDYEKGALIVVNSWGKDWGDNGKSYVAYNVLARYGAEGGFWNRSVHMIELVNNYSPQLTMKATLVHPIRNSLKIMAGISLDPYADRPDFIHEFPLFNFQGGGYPFGGKDAEPGMPFELGLDISPLLDYIEPGDQAAFFMLVKEGGGYSVNSKITEFSVIDYTSDTLELLSPEMNVPLKNLDTTFISVAHTLDFKKVKVKEYPLEFVRANNWHSLQLEAANLTSPFQWSLDYGFEAEIAESDFPEVEGTELGASGNSIIYTRLELPFSFPFYGSSYDEIIINDDGSIFFDSEFYEYPYVIDPGLIFKVKKGIIPFGQDLVYYRPETGIRYEDGDSVFTIAWAGLGVGDETSYLFQIACKLYKDGLIEFYYGPVEDKGEFRVDYDSGISSGDGSNYIISPLASNKLYRPNSVMRFRPYPVPEKIILDSRGLLRCRPEEENKFYEIHVKVKDKLNQIAYGVVPLSTLDLKSSKLLDQNYPNPFTASTFIRFIVPEDDYVNLSVYDLAGRKVSTLIDEEMNKGRYEVEWNARDNNYRDLPPGVYISRFTSGERDEKVKMVKIRY